MSSEQRRGWWLKIAIGTKGELSGKPYASLLKSIVNLASKHCWASPTGFSQWYPYIAQRYDTLYRAIEVCIELCSVYNEIAFDIAWMY